MSARDVAAFVVGALAGWHAAVILVALAQADGRVVSVDSSSWVCRVIAWWRR